MTLLPDDLLSTYLGGGIIGMILVCFVGVAFYICASGATPLVAALIAKGMSPGTALALLLAGPATSLASIAAVRSMLGNRGMTIYLATIIVCAVGLGLGLDFFVATSGVSIVMRAVAEQHQHASIFLQAIAIALVLFLAVLKIKPLFQGKSHHHLSHAEGETH